MWRASPRRLFICILSIISGVLLFLNIHQTFRSFPENLSNTDYTNNLHETTRSVKTPSSVRPSRESSLLPWYIDKGVLRPEPGKFSSNVNLFPEESPNNDRISGKKTKPSLFLH